VDDVVVVTPGAAAPLRFEPMYSFRHGAADGRRLFWYANRRPVGWRPEKGSEVWLSFVDASGRRMHPDVDAVTARLTCHNGDLPSRLPFGDVAGDFEMPGGGPIARIVALIKPTQLIEPPIGKPQLWRLISLLSLNYISLIEGGADAIRELLRLHNTADATAGERQLQGILGVRGSPVYSRIESAHGLTFARGHRVEIDFDEEQFAGGGVYLIAAVLERFLGLYVSLNSFTVFAARSKQRSQPLAEWPPRSGWKSLL
jgi:type VI secretion system protein ImpG